MWKCLKCAETLEDEFDACWSCGCKKDGTFGEFNPEVEIIKSTKEESKLTERIAFKGFRLERNRVVLGKSMIPLDSVSLITYGNNPKTYAGPLLFIGVIVSMVGYYLYSYNFSSNLGIITMVVGALLITAAFYRTSEYRIFSNSEMHLSIKANSDANEHKEFENFSMQVLDAKEKYIKR